MRTNELFGRITQQIITSIEAGADKFIMPWHRWGESTGSPINATSGRPYRGINTLLLWAAAELDGRSSGRWGTYKQWAAAGAQVRKSERASAIVFWKTANNPPASEDEASEAAGPRFVGRVYHVFNADQVDGDIQDKSISGLSADERIARAEAFFEAGNANVHYGGDRAYYAPSQDVIQMPKFEQFRDRESYYSVLSHEFIHWTGAEHRLARELRSRFGSDDYALEELIAELGAAFLAGYLGITVEPRPDHAKYLSSWLRVLRSDARALLTVSAKAQQAVDYIVGLVGQEDGDCIQRRSGLRAAA